jgi:hypothetical protein
MTRTSLTVGIEVERTSDIYRMTPYEFALTAEPQQITVICGRQIQSGSPTVNAPNAPVPSPAQTPEYERCPATPFPVVGSE